MRTRKMRCHISFRASLIVLLLVDALLPVTLLGIVSLGNITSLARTRFDESIQRNLSKTNDSIDGIIDKMVDTSQLLAFDQSITERLTDFFSDATLYNRLAARGQLEKQISLLETTNKNLAIAYYGTNGQIIYSKALQVNFYEKKHEELACLNWVMINGPHGSARVGHDYPVISSTCYTLNKPNSGIRIYTESSITPVLQEMDSTIFGIPIAHVIVNDKGIICYSRQTSLFRQGESFDKDRIGDTGKYEVFSQENNKHFSIYAIVEKKLIDDAIYNWIQFCMVVLALSFLLSLTIAAIILRVATKPLSDFSRELTLMVNDNIYVPGNIPRVQEFNVYIEQFYRLRKQVWELLDVVRLDAQREANWEVEKLLYQINPHFLHNTLDIIRWKAKIKGDDEIENIVNSLNRLLHYNLNKGSYATINEEVNAVRAYIHLQKNRFDFSYIERIEPGIGDLQVEIPRFVLQPLIENAILHGLQRSEGTIVLSISRLPQEELEIRIEDDGVGMTEAQVTELMKDSAEVNSAYSFGIGVSYVIRTLKKKFGSLVSFQIESAIGEGTQVAITIPIMGEAKE